MSRAKIHLISNGVCVLYSTGFSDNMKEMPIQELYLSGKGMLTYRLSLFKG